jgi:hypothetical protein
MSRWDISDAECEVDMAATLGLLAGGAGLAAFLNALVGARGCALDQFHRFGDGAGSRLFGVIARASRQRDGGQQNH